MPDLVFRTAAPADAAAIVGLISSHQAEGHLLPRQIDEIRRRAGQFVVCESGGVVVACAELAPLSPRLGEVRSLVVADDFRRLGIATRLLNELRERARAAGFELLAALTHDASLFVRHQFSIVPHVWLPEKIAKDCHVCPLFRECGQHAMLLPLTSPAPGRGAIRMFPRRTAAVA
jgi:amino-acid N-acetyltransferase